MTENLLLLKGSFDLLQYQKTCNKLDDIVSKYNNTYHSTSKMKPVYTKSNTYIDSSQEIKGIVRSFHQKN